ncbi:hypothetical protein PC122_g13003 [Phytophthora cactorum]|nr:hypothetical protein PC122_g13003 [Phytophthora cactorum]
MIRRRTAPILFGVAQSKQAPNLLAATYCNRLSRVTRGAAHPSGKKATRDLSPSGTQAGRQENAKTDRTRRSWLAAEESSLERGSEARKRLGGRLYELLECCSAFTDWILGTSEAPRELFELNEERLCSRGPRRGLEIWRASSFQDLKSLAAMGGWMRIEMNLIKHNYERPGLGASRVGEGPIQAKEGPSTDNSL